jgi:hypothetical protein
MTTLVHGDPTAATARRSGKLTAGVAAVQGVYFAATGVWSLVDIDSFQAVTGAKTDLWLVYTVGVLVLAVGVVLLSAAWSGRTTPEVVLLGVGSAAALAGIDVVFVARGVIAPVYLLDAAAEGVLILGWLVGSARGAGGHRQ